LATPVTIVDNDQSELITNTFNGLAEKRQQRLGSPFRIKYTGADGQGNDATLFVPPARRSAWQQPAGAEIATGGSAAFGNVNVGGFADLIFTIENRAGRPQPHGQSQVAVSGANSALLPSRLSRVRVSSPSMATTTFTVHFAPTSIGAKAAALSIANDDSNENPYIIKPHGRRRGSRDRDADPLGAALE